MKLSIITINLNNLSGLTKTVESVLGQSSIEFEYIIIDGSSSDGSVEFIEQKAKNNIRLTKWVSESDNGIYNAMNKGIELATGDYLQFLNSGDFLVNDNIVEKMLESLDLKVKELRVDIQILYGNMLKVMPKSLLRDKSFAGKEPTMLDFYRGTLNHSPAYIKRSLFEQYGLYDETLKIVSDWKWYMNIIIWRDINPVYINIDVIVFDMQGISSTSKDLDRKERIEVLRSVLPKKILDDYEKYYFPIKQFERMQQYKLVAKTFRFIERILFKYEQSKKSFFNHMQ